MFHFFFHSPFLSFCNMSSFFFREMREKKLKEKEKKKEQDTYLNINWNSMVRKIDEIS